MKKDRIIKVIRSKKNRPLTAKDIGKILKIEGDKRSELNRMLDELETSGRSSGLKITATRSRRNWD